MTQLTIETVPPEHPLWTQFVAHLHAVDMAAHGLDRGQPIPDTTYLGAVLDCRIIGHIGIKKQSLIAPATVWSENMETPICDSAGNLLYEMFVQTFAVAPTHRRSGCGRALQLAALDKARELGCHQLRSWSSTDKTANYALKISMGFAIHPATYRLPDGRHISGVYFVKSV